MSAAISRLLLVRADRIGDLMHVTPMVQSLAALPGLTVDVLARSPATTILGGNPCIGQVLDARWDDVRLGTAIRAGGYDAVAHLFSEPRLIGLCRDIPRSVRKGPLPWFGCHRRVIIRRSQSRQSEALYNGDLVRVWWPELVIDPRPRIYPAVADQERALQLMPTPRPLLNPGSGHPAGAWPVERFAEVARGMVGVCGRPLVVWGPGEEALAQRVAELGSAELAPATSLLELAALARRSTVMVTNDTGPMHIAAAAGAPLVVVWEGSRAIRPSRWGHHFRPDIINLDPFDGSADTSDNRQRRLRSITAEQVLVAVRRIACAS